VPLAEAKDSGLTIIDIGSDGCSRTGGVTKGLLAAAFGDASVVDATTGLDGSFDFPTAGRGADFDEIFFSVGSSGPGGAFSDSGGLVG